MAAKTKVTLLIHASAYDIPSGSAGSSTPSRSFGFSETWYSALAPANPLLKTAIRRLREKRAALLNNGCAIIGHRVAVVDGVGLAKTFRETTNGSSGEASDPVHNALLWYMDADGQPNKRQLLLRGIPDNRVVSAGYEPSVAYNRALLNFFTEILASWKFRGKDMSGAKADIDKIELDPNDATVAIVTTKDAHAFIAGNRVQILKTTVTGDRQKGSTNRVTNVPDANHFKLDNWKLGVTKGGKARKVLDYLLLDPQIDDAQVLRPLVVHRDTGRPFFLSRGRRSKRTA